MAERAFPGVDHLMAVATAPAPAPVAVSRRSLAEQIGQMSAELTDRNVRLIRALDIMARNPEFEELLEILRKEELL